MLKQPFALALIALVAASDLSSAQAPRKVNLAGTVVIFGSALGFILRESVALDRLTRQCLDAGLTCWPQPSAFSRYAIYAAIGLLEVIGLFLVSLKVERRMRRRHYAPEWQR